MKNFSLSAFLSIILSIGLFACSQSEEIIDISAIHDVDNEIEVTDPKMVNKKELNRVIIDHLMGDSDKSRSSLGYTVSTIKDDNGNDAIYVVNFTNDGGFVLVSAVKNYYPILAYSDYGNFDVSRASNLGTEKWIESAKSFIQHSDTINQDTIANYHSIWRKYELRRTQKFVQSRSCPDEYQLQQIFQDSISSWMANSDYNVIWYGDPITGDESQDQQIWQDAIDAVYPLYEEEAERFIVGLESVETTTEHIGVNIQTKWKQYGGFNQTFPFIEGTDTRADAGCVTVAVGQVMYYYKHPNYFNWDDMPLRSGTVTTSNFLLALVNKVKQYGPVSMTENGTSIFLNQMSHVLNDYGYNCIYTQPYKKNILDRNLRENKPVIIGATKDTDNSIGHAFIIYARDSTTHFYRKGIWTFTDRLRFQECWGLPLGISGQIFYAINWGWGGSRDGYYDLSITNNTTHYSQSNFTDMIHDITPKN